jgi:hypothetical protein
MCAPLGRRGISFAALLRSLTATGATGMGTRWATGALNQVEGGCQGPILAEAHGTMMVCDYNGWNDAPEDEREALDLVEPTLAPPSLAVSSRSQRGHSRGPTSEATPNRQAA